MAKRPSLLANIDMAPAKSVAAPAAATPPAAPAKSDTVKTSLYLPPKAHHKLKEIALAEGCKVHDLVIEGLNKVLAEKGFPPVDEIGKV